MAVADPVATAVPGIALLNAGTFLFKNNAVLIIGPIAAATPVVSNAW